MLRRQIFPLVLFQFIIFCAHSQKIIFPDCDSSSLKQLVFTRAEVMPKLKGSALSLSDLFNDFFKTVPDKETISGRMLIRFFIDKNGNGCCLQIDNNLGIPINPDTLKDLLNDKLKWEPAMQNNYLVSCFKGIYVIFRNGIMSIRDTK